MKFVPAKCTRCQQPTLVLWVNGAGGFCEQCLTPSAFERQPSENNHRLLFAPQRRDDGTWDSNPSVTFGDWRQFIDESLRPSSASAFKECLVVKPDTLSRLIDLLESKIPKPSEDQELKSARKQGTTLSEELAAMGSELERIDRQIGELDTKIYHEREEKVRTVLRQELGTVRKRRKLLALTTETKTAQLKNRQAQVDLLLREHPATVQTRTDKRLRRDYALWKLGALEQQFNVPVDRVYWELLKPSGDSWNDLIRHFECLSRTRNERYEVERLKFIYDFKPDHIYIGLTAFEGYVVFCFERGETAVLECPQVGNALYLMDLGEWRFLSILSKTELLEQHSKDVDRIIHGDFWRSEFKSKVRLRGIF